ncbi:hypothetical protein MPSEU_000096800 [Mayamaea pseudoterrestris]|nr:hypothetical protein MPSEU_000096800 [Mayamaea pseudoterrestris]
MKHIVLIHVMAVISLRTASSFVHLSKRSCRSCGTNGTIGRFATSQLTEQVPVVLNPLVICGPSGVGKGSIIDIYMNKHGGRDRFGFSVSHTTRQPRPEERHGVHYHFVKRNAFSDSTKFVEHAEVHGNYYGTSWDALRHVQMQGKKALLDIDCQGVKRLKSYDTRKTNSSDTLFLPRFIFIAPPSLETLHERLIARGTESPESLQRRLANAEAEVEYGLAQGNFDAIIINDDLSRAASELAETIASLYVE